MADRHPDHSSQTYSVQRQSQLHTQFRQHQHQQQQQQPQHLQVTQTQRIYRQDNRQGPYSAGVIEDRRAFPMFRGSGSSSSSSTTTNNNSNGGRTFAHPSSSFTSRGSSSTASRTLTISDILERFSAAPEEFVMTVLNAKAKEDELKAEEERYKTEVLKLESRKLDISLAIEKRQTSPPAGRSYASSTAESSVPMHAPPAGNFHHGYSTYPTPAQPSMQVDNTRSHYSGAGHQDAQEQAPQQQPKASHDQAKLPSTPPSRPAPPRIDTAARQGNSLQHQHQLKRQQQQQQIQRHLQQQQQSGSNSQRIPPSPSTQSPVSSKPSASTSGRHHILHPFRSSSAQSSPVTNVDMQSQIPQPLSPDEYASPTSATPSGSGLKRKSINHDEVMDAIRAKVLRNAAAGQQQQKEQREKPHRKTSGDLAGRRKPHPLNSSINSNDTNGSPDRSKRPATTATVNAAESVPTTSERVASPRHSDTSSSTSPTDRPSLSRNDGFAPSHGHRVVKQEEVDETLLSPHPITRSPPASMSPPSSASRSNSSSPRMESGKYDYQRQYQRQEDRQSRNEPLLGPSEKERARLESISYAEDERRSRYNMDRSCAERPSEVGGSYKNNNNNNTMAPKHKKSKTSGGAPPAPAQGGAKSSNKAAKAKAIAEARIKADVAPITHISQNRRGHQQNHGGFAKFDNKDQSEKLKPKEKTEVELENLIFGADNQELLGEAFSRIGHELSSDEEEGGDDGFDYDLEVGFGDDEEGGMGEEGGDMFFMDAGPTPVMREEIDEDAEDMEEPVDEEIGEGEDVEEEGASEDEEVSRLTAIYGGKPAWVDEDDKTLSISLKSANRLKKLRKQEAEDVVNGVDYEQRLRRQFEKVYPVPNWAQPEGSRKRRRGGANAIDSDSDYSDEEQEQEDTSIILTSSKGFLEKSNRLRVLSSESIAVTRVKNANQMGPSKSVIQSVEFHPNSQMLLTAGFDRTLRLFQVDGKLNQLMQSVFYKDLPIYKAAFSPAPTSGSGAGNNTVVVSGRRKYFYSYDIEAGKVDKSQGIYGRNEKSLEKFVLSPCGTWIAFLGRDGYIILVTTRTRLWAKNLKMSGNVRAVAWSSDSEYLYSVGGDAEIYQWQVSSGKCVHRFMDEGGFKPTCLAVSPNDKFFAVGSKSGVVNVYDRTCLETRTPKALRAIGNLTTSIHTMRFNHDSQILAISSKARKDQLRLIHIPSLKVFPNWPTKGTPLSYVTCLAFSPRSGYFAIGNDKGKVLLYRLNHYPSA